MTERLISNFEKLESKESNVIISALKDLHLLIIGYELNLDILEKLLKKLVNLALTTNNDDIKLESLFALDSAYFYQPMVKSLNISLKPLTQLYKMV